MRPPFRGSPGEGSQPSLNERPGASGLASARFANLPAQCIFCAHVNPAGAKFCNDCGSPLHLKPCRQCDAINDRAARRCYNCGIADPVLEPPPEPAPKVVVTEATAGSAAPNDVRIETLPATQRISGAEAREEISLPDDNATTAARESDAVVAAPQPSPVDGDIGFASPEIASEGRAAERPQRSRWPIAGVLSATAVAAVAVYVYRTDLSSQQSREAPYATQAPAATAEPIPAKIDVPVASTPPLNAVSTSATSSPLPQDEARARDAASVGEPALTSSPSSATVPSQPQPAAKKSPTTAKTTAKKAKKTPPKKAASTPAAPATKAATTHVPKTAE